MSKERELLPTREQIEAIKDLPALREIADNVEWRRQKIETDLEFGDGDEEWAGRARSALTAHRICFGHVERQMRRLTRGAVVEPAGPSNAEKKTAKHIAAAERAVQETEARRAKLEQAKLAQQDRIAGIVERTSWLSYFHKAAVRLLDADTLERLIDAAERDYSGRIKHEIKTAA